MLRNLHKIKNQLEEVIRQVRELKKPDKIKEPPAKDKEAEKKVESLSDKIKESDAVIRKSQSELNEYSKKIKTIEDLIYEIKQYSALGEQLKEKLRGNDDILKTGILANKLIKIETDVEPLEDLVKRFKNNLESANTAKTKATTLKIEYGEEIEKLRSKMTNEQKKYQEYLRNIEDWEYRRQSLIGDCETEGTVLYLSRLNKFLTNELPERKLELQKKRLDIGLTILKLINEREETLKSIYDDAQKEAEQQAKKLGIPVSEFLQFSSEVRIKPEFDETFLGFINRGRAGSFYREMERKTLDMIKKRVNILDPKSCIEFPEMMLQALTHNIIKDPECMQPEYEMPIEEQLRSGAKREELYDYIYGFDYLDYRFSISYNNKHLHLLSPGEKGILLLVFYLIIDKDRKPIIIDQPEENLDNETVYVRLVKCIKTAKKDRQIIIVTHNPNLAVVCDAEQVIYAELDKGKNNTISYSSGSIENDNIKAHIVRVLEGTKPAFVNRKSKYNI